MPTDVTVTVSKLLHLMSLRKNCLQRMGEYEGVTFEYVSVLEDIRKHPGCIQADISKRLRLTPSAITQSTKKLEALGYIRKETDKGNLRVKMIYITDKGEKMLQSGTKLFDEADKLMFADFSKEDRKCLEEYVDRLSRNLKKAAE